MRMHLYYFVAGVLFAASRFLRNSSNGPLRYLFRILVTAACRMYQLADDLMMNAGEYDIYASPWDDFIDLEDD